MKLMTSLLGRRKGDKVNFKLKKFKDHEEMANRLTKTFYYGNSPKTDRPSLAMTNIAVELFTKAIPDGGLGEIDMHYAASVSRNACVSPCSLMLALVYIDRLRHRNPDYLQTVSSSDIFLVSMMIASKFLYDEGEEDEVFNDEWAASANLDTKDVNHLERNFLAALDWNVFVDCISLSDLLHRLESQIALQEGLKRGWFSYTDLDILSQNLPALTCLNLIVDNIFKVAVVCAITYTAGIMTMVASTYIVHRAMIATHCGNLSYFGSLNYISSLNDDSVGKRSQVFDTSSNLPSLNDSGSICDSPYCKFQSTKAISHPFAVTTVSSGYDLVVSASGSKLHSGNDSTIVYSSLDKYPMWRTMLIASVPKFGNLHSWDFAYSRRAKKFETRCDTAPSPIAILAR